MYDIRDMPSQIPAEDIALLAQGETATFGHFRYMGFADREIRPVTPKNKTVGTAVTLALPAHDSTLLHHVMQFLRPNDVLIIDRLGDRLITCFGGVMAAAAAEMNIAGVIIDGPCADPQELRDINLPIWSRGYSPVTTRLADSWGAFNIPISCGGVAVHPGDAVLADENGVLFLKPEDVIKDATLTIEKQNKEKHTLAFLKQGKQIGKISNATSFVRNSN